MSSENYITTQHYNTNYEGLIYISTHETYHTIIATADITFALGKLIILAKPLQAPKHTYLTQYPTSQGKPTT